MLDHRKCKASTGIDDSITAGQGRLDEMGFWEIPCPECALRFARLVDRSRHDDELISALSSEHLGGES